MGTSPGLLLDDAVTPPQVIVKVALDAEGLVALLAWEVFRRQLGVLLLKMGFGGPQE